jgi:hypothetical protein
MTAAIGAGTEQGQHACAGPGGRDKETLLYRCLDIFFHYTLPWSTAGHRMCRELLETIV